MSLADLLPAIRALPVDDRRQLVHLLIDELAGPALPEDRLPEYIGEMLRHGGVVSAGSQITTDAAGWQAIQEAMAELKGAE
ncbi:MAG: hypothetical protein K2X82_26930 [Gemmataceae bacterium]|nr:hypothetical protein [Gemmataceae bacterium]